MELVDQLKELGLDSAAGKLNKKVSLKRKLAIAYEHYRFVSPGVFDRFQKRLKEKTYRVEVDKDFYSATPPSVEIYDTLAFVKLAEYGEIPPPDCLLDLKTAKDMACFDSFEVAKVETVEVRPDPIIFGCIDNCEDKFFVTQWDADVAIEDILEEGEG